jgi:hypothetical protein
VTARRALLGAASLVVTVGLARCGGHDAPLDRARAIVHNPSNFGTGREAGDTMVRAANQLLAEARACIADHGETPYCLSFRSAAAWSNVAGVKALTCRAPGRAELRRHAIALYDQLRDLSPAARDIPRNPPLPACD